MNDLLICTFYTPGGYYEECAGRLKDNIAALGLDLHIEEMVVPEGKTWPEICRRKIPYLHRVRRENPDRLLFWIDVDCQLTHLPGFIRNSSADLIGFQRGFSDPLTIGYEDRTRFWEPCFLGFGRSRGARRFLDVAHDLEKTTDIYATDDYFFEEAWRREARNLSFQIIPATLSKADDMDRFFHFGSSSNVGRFKGKVKQHAAPAKSARPRRRRKSLARRIALACLPDPVIRGLVKGRDHIRVRLAMSNVHKVQHDRSRDLALKDFNILVKKVSALEDGPTDGLHRLSARVAAPIETVDASLRWGSAFRAYRGEEADPAAVPLVWWDTPSPGNFGDWLSPYIVSKISGRPVRYVKPDAQSGARHVIGVGSIAKFARENSTVCGSGIADRTTILNPRATYVSVRGPFTAETIRASGGRAPEVFGDPAILMRRLYAPRSPVRTGASALVRHIRHQELDIRLPDHMKELSIWASHPEDVEAFIDELATKDFVVTSAMHCFIVCQSYGIPAALVTFEGREDVVPGDGVKYRDYLLGVGQREFSPIVVPTDLRGVDLHNLIVDETIPDQRLDDLHAVTKSALSAF